MGKGKRHLILIETYVIIPLETIVSFLGFFPIFNALLFIF